MAQSGSAPALGAGGPEFEPRRPDHFFVRSRGFGRPAAVPRDMTTVAQILRAMAKRSPLAVFLLLGIAAFAMQSWLSGGRAAPRVVTLSTEHIDALRARWSAQWGREPDGRELRGLIDEAVREAILAREAQRMFLDRGDPIVRRRLAQKMTFLLEDTAETLAPSGDELEAYFRAHAARYREPRRTTFRHVFLDGARRIDPQADAAALLGDLQRGGGDRWRSAGDRFRLLDEYANRTDREITALFGGGFTAALADLAPGAWRGPVRSEHGTHLVRVLGRADPRIPALADVRERVAADLAASRRRARNRDVLEDLRARYNVRIHLPETPGEGP